MSYEMARSALATLLEGAAITSPITETIGHVYSDPPATIQDLPCLVLYGSTGSRDWMTHGLTSVAEEHTERVRLLVHDVDQDRAANIIRAYRAAILTVIAASPTLSNAARISRIAWEEPASFGYGGVDLTGLDLLITFRVMSP